MSEARSAAPADATPVSHTERQRTWSRFLLVALALHIPLFFYPILRICFWLGLPWWLTASIFVPLASSQVVSRLYLRGRHEWWAVIYKRCSDFWLGLSPLVFIALVLAEIPVALAWVTPFRAAVGILAVAVLLGCIGVASALKPFVKRIGLTVSGINSPVRMVQITDVHIGSRSQRFLEEVIGRVNRLEPDLLCITGDFIDAPGIPETTLRSLKSVNCPIYYCIGNHEKYEDLDDIVQRLKNLGVNVLRNDSTRFRDDFQIIGIDDMDDAHQVERELRAIEVDREGFALLLYHRPRGLEAAASAGINLMLSGHTHNGQIMPFNLVVGRVFDRAYGLHHYESASLYVSQGTGTWGPVMRVGTRSEITLFELTPKAV
ncbi:MAG TPA: metallophosphoesterase [Pseudomonadales bacterium]|nr:metallophosphoesterase [Pseudomonadales bacterium]